MVFEFDQVVEAVSEKVPLETTPDFVRPVCIVSGDFYEMGVQYGQQQYNELRSILLWGASSIKNVWKDHRQLTAAVEGLENAVAQISPESIELYNGISEGADLPYSAVLTAFFAPTLSGLARNNHCSTISAWGNASGGKLIAGTNADGPAFTVTNYSPVLLMFPEKGNSIIANGGVCSNLVMNNKGMVGMASAGGWNGRPEDVGIGLPGVLPTSLLSWKYDTASDAISAVSKISCSMAENLHFVDKNTGAFVLEHTYGHQAVRKSGEYGEQDFMVTTNHFVSEEMQASRPEDDRANHNSYSRYKTEIQALTEQHGNLTLEKLGEILSLQDRYDDLGWHREEWDEIYSLWTPEKHGPFNKTYMQTLAMPEETLFYIRQGQSNWRTSVIPGITGNFVQFFLKNTPEESVAKVETETVLQLWKYAKAARFGESNSDLLDRARTYIWYGKNHRAQSVLSNNKHTKMYHLSKALHQFSRAQSLLGMCLK